VAGTALSLDFHGALFPRLWVEFPFSDASSPSTTIARAKVVAITCWPPNRYLFSDQEKLLMAETEDSSQVDVPTGGAVPPSISPGPSAAQLLVLST